jgi:regulator of sigma E protease
MLDTVQTVLIAIATFSIVVAVHEYGHFWVARRSGVKVLRFSVGFGRPLIRWRGRDDVEYVVAVLPLGGYVRMADEREDNVADEDLPRAYNRQPVARRMAIAAAGPAANFLLAVLVLWMLFLRGEVGIVPLIDQVSAGSLADRAGLVSGQEILSIDDNPTPTLAALNFALLERLGDSGTLRLSAAYPGLESIHRSEVPIERWLAGEEQPNLLAALGITIQVPPVLPLVGALTDGSAAVAAGFQVGDLILQADGQAMPLWMDWVGYVRERPEVPIDVLVQRDGTTQLLTVVPRERVIDNQRFGSVGMTVSLPDMPESQQRRFERGPLTALWASIQRTGDLIGFTFKSMGRMLQGLISPANLSGPIAIAQVAASTAEAGWVAWLGFVALLSVSLGALNLLPIPVLDGGHLMFYSVEALLGKPLPERVQMVGVQIGLVLVMSIMVFALYNDLSKL